MKRIAVITGASSGLGAAFAVQYAARYAAAQRCDELWLIARRADRLDETKRLITASCSAPRLHIRTIPLDISGSGGVRQFQTLLRQEAACNPFTLILLINNAGFGIYGPFADTPPDEVLSMIDTDIYALTGFCAAALPVMQPGAHIINTASLAAFLPVGNYAVYAAAKSYVMSFSLSLNAELKGRNIGVTAVCPGQVATEFAQRALGRASAKMPRGAQDPHVIAAHGLRCAFRHAPLAVWGWQWKLQAFASRFVGRSLFATVSFRWIKRL